MKKVLFLTTFILGLTVKSQNSNDWFGLFEQRINREEGKSVINFGIGLEYFVSEKK